MVQLAVSSGNRASRRPCRRRGIPRSELAINPDIQFATLYFNALNGYLTGGECPGCWSAMFAVRNQTEIARIQFALAGMNSHINHDLPFAIIATCKSTNTVPQHETPQYNDYTSLNQTMDALIEKVKHNLDVRLLGNNPPAVTHLEDTLASWDLAAARESAWDSAQNLWQETPVFLAAHMKIIDGLTTVISKALLIPAP